MSKQEQMSFIVWYFTEYDQSIQERFLTYVHTTVFDVSSLTQYIKDTLEFHDLDPLCIVSQSYDGASVMSGKCTGVQTRVREFAPHAMYMHCHAHILNLVLVDSVKSINRAAEFFALLQTLYVFMSSSKIHEIFKAKQQQLHPGMRPMELQKLSDTRWVARYASVNAVCRTFDSILPVMEDVADGSDIDKAIEARGLYHQIHPFSFIVSLVTFDKILSCTKHLSDQLQGKTVDLSIATDLILATKSLLSDL